MPPALEVHECDGTSRATIAMMADCWWQIQPIGSFEVWEGEALTKFGTSFGLSQPIEQWLSTEVKLGFGECTQKKRGERLTKMIQKFQ